MPDPIRVALVEDDAVTRDGLRLLIDAATGFQCQAAYSSAEEALRLLQTPPDVLLLDIGLPGMSGADGARLFADRFPGLQILMLTVFANRENIFRSICNGACGYLLKNVPAARLLESIRQAYEGGSPMSPEVARQVVTLFRKTASAAGPVEALTPQETRLLSLLADGYSYLNAAGQLSISVNTVRNYVRNIYEKLHVHTKSEAVSKAMRAGLLD
ncbi:MAG: response regulator transcription factor [Acidobacteria bacterium]|nr:response regulator transcription factor [Acidobacteriota bacterium]